MLTCEGCRKTTDGWPDGWIGCFRSSFNITARGHRRIAMWCPDCVSDGKIDRYKNPPAGKSRPKSQVPKPLLFLLCVTLAGSVGAGSRDNVVLDEGFNSLIVSTAQPPIDPRKPYVMEDESAFCAHKWVYTDYLLIQKLRSVKKHNPDVWGWDENETSDARADVKVQMCQKCGVLRVRP